MSLIAPDSLKAIAESVGIADFSDDAAKLLAPDVEYRLREIAQVSDVHVTDTCTPRFVCAFKSP